MSQGYIKLDRALESWRYKTFPNYVALWVHLLLKANHKETKYADQTIQRGELLTSIEKLKEGTGLTTQQIRTILEKLNGEEITIKSTNKFTLINIVKYGEYQSSDGESNKQITNEQQTNNKQITTYKNVKNVKNVKKNLKDKTQRIESKEINKQMKEINKKNKYGEYKHVELTDEQIEKLYEQYGVQADTYIKFLDEYIEMKGYKAKNHYLAIKKWVVDAVKEDEIKKAAIQEKQKKYREDTLPVYDISSNTPLDKSRFEEIIKKRNQKEGKQNVTN